MERRSKQTEYVSDGKSLTGYAAIWDSPSHVISERGKTFTEIVKRGAFTRSISQNKDILCCYNHDTDRFLGRSSSGTLKLSEDNIGLKFEVCLPDTPTGNEVRELCQRGDLSGCSFAFQAKKDQWDKSIRQLLDVDLFELGPVLSPAYPKTQLGLRSMYKYKLELMKRK